MQEENSKHNFYFFSLSEQPKDTTLNKGNKYYPPNTVANRTANN